MSSSNPDWITVLKTNEVEEGSPVAVNINGFEIVIFRDADENFYATDNVCTHANAYLSDGFQEGCTIECPLHAGCFDIRTGKALTAPLTVDLRTYPLRIDGDDILIKLEA